MLVDMNKTPFNEGRTVVDNGREAGAVVQKQSGFLAKHAVTLAIMAVSSAVLVISLGYRVGNATAPGPGLWPAAIAAVVLVLCVVLIFSPHLDADSNERLENRQWRLLAFAIIPLLLFVPIMLVAGAPIASVLLAFYSLKVLHGRPTMYSVLWAAILTVAVYLIFILGLGISLPVGLIFGGTL
ncbi:UNVERIFIED_ORG: putative tricarboxylic transport membrane protein [Arthrobacter sp. UYCu721]